MHTCNTHYDQFCGGSEVSANVWHHVAVDKHGATLFLFKNGNLVQSLPNGNSFGANAPSFVGIEHPCICYFFNGYIDEFLLSKGIARWTQSFDPPYEAY